jgi:hypothetical protein
MYKLNTLFNKYILQELNTNRVYEISCFNTFFGRRIQGLGGETWKEETT